jgi:hypothetical protein
MHDGLTLKLVYFKVVDSIRGAQPIRCTETVDFLGVQPRVKRLTVLREGGAKLVQSYGPKW